MTDLQEIFTASKIHHHRERLDAYAGSRNNGQSFNVVPVTMELDLTNVCSHRCPLCVGRRTPESGEEQLFAVAGDGESIPTDAARDYLDQMATAGVQGIIFTGGGEPTLHRHVVELITHAHSVWLDAGLITHGGLLHRLDVQALLRATVWIRISIDAADPASFKETHGRNETEWDRVWSNIELLTRTRQAQASTAPTTIGLGFLASPQNIGSLPKLAALAQASGVDYLQVRPFHSHSTYDARQEIQEAADQFNTERFQVIGSLQKYSRLGAVSALERTYDYCHINHFASVIAANQKMYLCCHYRNIDRYCIGDLRTASFKEILVGEQRRRVAEGLDVSDCIDLCRGDHTNRLVEQYVTIKPPPEPATGPEPLHASFL